MEALSSGSSANFRLSTADAQYEFVSEVSEDTHIPERDRQDEEHVKIVAEYEEPDRNFEPQTQIHVVPAHNKLDEYLQIMSTASDVASEQETQQQSNFKRHHPSRSPIKHRSPSRTPEKLAAPVATAAIDDSYEPLDCTSLAAPHTYEDALLKPPKSPEACPRKSTSVPKELSALSEITVEDIPSSNLSQKEAQLWTLNQMQKLVQKLEGMYEQIAVGTVTQIGQQEKATPSATVQDIDEIYDEVDDIYRVPIRGLQFYPPVPPRTHSCKVKNTPGRKESPIDEELRHRLKTGALPGPGRVSPAKAKLSDTLESGSSSGGTTPTKHDQTCELTRYRISM